MTKDKMINYRTTEAEHAKLYDAARKTHLSMSGLIRLCIATQLHRLVAKFGRS